MSRTALSQLIYRYPQKVQTSVKHRPEKAFKNLTWFDQIFYWLYKNVFVGLCHLFISDGRVVKKIIRRSEAFSELTEAEFQQLIIDVRAALVEQGVNNQTLVESFAMVREAAFRTLSMRHHHTQIRASLILLRGMVAEMATGEGKTLAGTLASCTAAMAGIKVHVITTNDYLAQRDCEEMQPLFDYLQIKAATITNESEIPERQAIYGGDIIYCSNNELVFDYLKDSLVLEDRRDPLDIHREAIDGSSDFLNRLMHQGLAFAIVDEADSVFIDESRTPLVISGGDVDMEDEEDYLRTVMSVATHLIEGTHFTLDLKNCRVLMRAKGVEAAEEICMDIGTPWYNLIRRQQMLTQALSALHLFHRDKHYIVVDDKIVIVDEYTGRPSGDRSWEGAASTDRD